MTVSVAIDLALDRFFTYKVPEALKEKLAVGQLLSVPFGHRETRGFAMAISDEAETTDAKYQLKPIIGIVDETPFFSKVLLELVSKVSEYTASPIESVLKAALPAAVLKRNAKAKEQIFVEPIVGKDITKLSKRQQWVYENLVRLQGGWVGWICRELQTTISTLRTLERSGLVKIEVRARRRDPLAKSRIMPSKPLKLNEEQYNALEAIGRQQRPLLLHGITGSGKTEVYLQAIAAELEQGRGAIVMVPEIALTPQTVQRFASRFGSRVAVLHSALSDGERYDEWHRIRSGEARVVVGPRSAVWAPITNLGLIVVDEEHETSYKQDESPRYHARDVAVLRGTMEKAKVVLGSATPSLESWMNVQRGKYGIATLKRRAGLGTVPAVSLVSMLEEKTKGAIFSQALLESLRLCMNRGEQAILFLNRRGYSRSVSCGECGYVMECPDCGVAYTYHKVDSCLRCHICGKWVPIPTKCPTCKCPAFDYKGIGTQRAEMALMKCFPKARVLRMDADSVARKNSHDEILAAFRRGDADILLGTQMIAKGLDFPNVTLVGVLNADASLNIPDFRAAERTFQLLAQVAGRAGRAELPGEVIIQSYDVDSPVLRAVVRGKYEDFAASELLSRKECYFPPYCHLALIGFRSKDLKLVGDWAEMYAKSLARCSGITVSDAIPATLEKADGWYRWQIVIRSNSVASILKAWRWITTERPVPKSIRAMIDMDAFSVL